MGFVTFRTQVTLVAASYIVPLFFVLHLPPKLRRTIPHCSSFRHSNLWRLSSLSVALLLCSTIFLLLPSCARACLTFSDIRGKYILERGTLKTCRNFSAVRNKGKVLTPNSISFGGVKCRSMAWFWLGRCPN